MKIIRIGLSVVLILSGIGGITAGDIAPAIFCILCGISLIPAIYKKVKLENNKKVQIIIPIILFIIFGMTMQSKGTTTKDNYSNNEIYTNNEVEKIIDVESLKLEENDIEIDIKETKDILLKINPIDADTSKLKFNTTNSQTVKLTQNTEKSNDELIYAEIHPVGEGEAEIYVSSDKIESNRIKVTVFDKERIENEKRAEEEKKQKEAEEAATAAAAEQERKNAEEQARKAAEAQAKKQTKPVTTQQTNQKSTGGQTKASTPSQNTNNSRTVYRAPTGKRYHYISTCGGKNSTATTLKDAIAMGLTPCQKCAQ